jgi:hypothetical protein
MPDGLLVPLFDKLIQLATLRETNRKRLFENHIDPLYQLVEVVASDYIAMIGRSLAALEQEPLDRQAFKQVRDQLAMDRVTFRAKRLQLWSTIEVIDFPSWLPSVRAFNFACQHFVSAAISTHLRPELAKRENGHTFDTNSSLLIQNVDEALSDESLVNPTPATVEIVRYTLERLEVRWVGVTSAYNRCRQDLLK